jgi:hypothetical protein
MNQKQLQHLLKQQMMILTFSVMMMTMMVLLPPLPLLKLRKPLKVKKRRLQSLLNHLYFSKLNH